VNKNFFGHLKSEYLELGDIPKTYTHLIKAVGDYIDFYNNRRPQRKLKGMTPIQFRLSYLSNLPFYKYPLFVGHFIHHGLFFECPIFVGQFNFASPFS
jgi:hypothetical protein